MAQEQRFRTRLGYDLGPWEEIKIPGAPKEHPQKRYSPFIYTTHQLGPGWLPEEWGEGATWRTPRNLHQAILRIREVSERHIRRYLAASLLVELWTSLVDAAWPDFEWADDFSTRLPRGSIQGIRDLLAAWAGNHGLVTSPASPRTGGLPPWLYHPSFTPLYREQVVNEYGTAIATYFADIQHPMLRHAIETFRRRINWGMYNREPEAFLSGWVEENQDAMLDLAAAIDAAIYNWWEQVALPTLLQYERTGSGRLPQPYTEESPYFMGIPWWLVVMDETAAYSETGPGRDLLQKAGGQIFSVWLWNPTDVWHYASPYNPLTDLHIVGLIPKESPDDENEQENLDMALLDELHQTADMDNTYAYRQIENFPRSSSVNLPPEKMPGEDESAIYTDYFDVTENLDDALEQYHQNPFF